VCPHVARVVCLTTPAALIHHGIHYPPADEIDDDAICRLMEGGHRTVAPLAGPVR